MTLLKARHSRDALPWGLRVVTPGYSSNFLVTGWVPSFSTSPKSRFSTSELSKAIRKDCMAPELATLCQTHKCCAETAAAQRSQGQLQNRKNHFWSYKELQRNIRRWTMGQQESRRNIRTYETTTIKTFDMNSYCFSPRSSFFGDERTWRNQQ